MKNSRTLSQSRINSSERDYSRDRSSERLDQPNSIKQQRATNNGDVNKGGGALAQCRFSFSVGHK